MVTGKEAHLAAEKFMNEHCCGGPLGEYITSVGYCPISTAIDNKKRWGFLRWRIGEIWGASKGISDEEKSDWCLLIGIKTSTPKTVKFPERYNGVRVVTAFQGEVRAL